MKNKVTKVMAFALALMMAVSVFAACDGNTASSTAEDNSQQASSAASAASPGDSSAGAENTAAQDPYTVRILMAGDATTEDCAEVSAALSQITEEKYNTTVEITRFGFGTYSDQVNLMLSSGEKMDLLPNLGVAMLTAANNGQILPLDDLLQDTGKDLLQMITEDEWECVKVNGEVYAVPNRKEHGGGVGYIVIKEILEETGIDPTGIQTQDDMEALFRKVKELHPDMAPLVSDNGSLGWFSVRKDDLGGDYGVLEDALAENFTVVNWYDTDTYRTEIERHYKWAQEGLILKDGSTNSEQGVDLLAAGKGFAMQSNTKPGVDIERELLIGKPIEVIELVEPYAQTGSIAGNVWFVAYNSEQPSRAMEILNEIYADPASSNLVVNGIEEKHYVMVDEALGVIGYPEDSSSSQNGYSSLPWAWPNELNTYTWESSYPDLWKDTEQFNADAAPSIAMGFAWNNENVLSEITACANVLAKYEKALACGELEPEAAIQKLNNELNSAGMQRIVDEKQKQLDAWRAS